MFRLIEISLHGWDLWSQVRVPLDRDVVLVIGPNGSGKTTLLDAIRQLLNASRLSSKRRVQHYIRRPEQPALIRAVVSNVMSGVSAQPFYKERVFEPEVTLACALVPSGGGSPEKRFAVLGGRPKVEDVQRLLLETREWIGPERYSKALENAGVTRSLLNVLAIEQGRANSLFELSPREMFLRVIEMLGDRAVLDRYAEARRQYNDTLAELFRQRAVLQQKEVELQSIKREVARLEEHEQARERVAELESRLPASELQQHLRRRKEMAPKVQELATKARKGEVEKIRLEEEARRAAAEEAAARAALAEARTVEAGAEEARAGAERMEAACEQELRRLEEKAREAASMPEQDLAALEAAEEAAGRALFEAERRRAEIAGRAREIRERIEKLEAGLPVYPGEVAATLTSLRALGVRPALLAETAEVTDPAMAEAAEAAVGDARYCLIVSREDREVAVKTAKENAFPGPVYAGPVLEAGAEAGPISLSTGAPAWVPAWMESVNIEPGGIWHDQRGTWVRRPERRVLGERGRAEELDRGRRELGGAEADLRIAAAEEEEGGRRRDAARRALAQERLRRDLIEEARLLPAAATAREAAAKELETARKLLLDSKQAKEAAAEAHLKASMELERLNNESAGHARQLAGETKTLAQLGEEMRLIEDAIAELGGKVKPELRQRAELGDLDGPDTVRADLDRAARRLAALGEPPPREVREEALHLEANVRELEGHVVTRQREVDEARGELDACRERYLEIVSATLQDYRERIEDVCRVAEVSVEMDLPRLENEDRVLDEACINVRFGFDGKQPLPLGHASFSGGQQVIAGMILLMGMAEIEGRGFFMLDEPFAHLSLDRIDQVGKFLRATRSQFILTAPTTLDRAQLDPASLVVVLRKKRPDDPFAPAPIVAEA